MYEHSETWTWRTGETAQLPFVSVHRVSLEDGVGKVNVWKDYWDFGAIVNSASASWMESLAASDTSWVFDATELI
jgi:hypothetical protein